MREWGLRKGEKLSNTEQSKGMLRALCGTGRVRCWTVCLQKDELKHLIGFEAERGRSGPNGTVSTELEAIL